MPSASMPVKQDTLINISPPSTVVAALIDLPVALRNRVFPQHLVRKGAAWSSGAPAIMLICSISDLLMMPLIKSCEFLRPLQLGVAQAASAGRPTRVKDDQSWRTAPARTWSVDEASYTGYYHQVKVTVHGCGYKALLSKKTTTKKGLRNNIRTSQVVCWCSHLIYRMKKLGGPILKNECAKA